MILSTNWLLPIGLGIISLLVCSLSCALTFMLIRLFKHRAILDLPNDRSLHATPVPRGGGWAIFTAFALGCLVFRPHIIGALPLIAATILLMLISWWDDLKNISQLPRFGAQIIAVIIGLIYLQGGLFAGIVPPALDYAVTALAWLWFINLFNFMDGMDGLAGGEAALILLGLFLCGGHLAALLLVAAILGFLIWNWAPAKIFLGDVGSIPLGYVIGFFLIENSRHSTWAASLILPLYFLIDASLTLLRRLLRRKKIWRPHREHAYQAAVQNGRSHRRVASVIMIANAVLLADVIWVESHTVAAALALAVAAMVPLFAWLYSKPRPRV